MVLDEHGNVIDFDVVRTIHSSFYLVSDLKLFLALIKIFHKNIWDSMLSQEKCLCVSLMQLNWELNK